MKNGFFHSYASLAFKEMHIETDKWLLFTSENVFYDPVGKSVGTLVQR